MVEIKIKCKGCGKVAIHNERCRGCIVIGNAVQSTGYYVLFSSDSEDGTVWLCPDCYAVARPLVDSLLAIVKTSYVSLNTFVNAAKGRKQ